MKYQILKTIIETSIGQFVCQQCQQKLTDADLHIKSITDNTVDLSLPCPHCRSETAMHAVIGGSIPVGEESSKSVIPKNEHAIKDTDITVIEQQLQNNNSIEDLLK